MAIDTAQDRASVVSVGRPWKRPRIISDGSFSAADRQQIGNNYSGVLVGLAVPVVSFDGSALVRVDSSPSVVILDSELLIVALTDDNKLLIVPPQ